MADPAPSKVHGADGRHVVLVGMMGSGKTSVGRRLARRIDRPFLDADEELEARTGRSVRAWFEADGEERFRKAETGLLAELLSDPVPAVIATGGGAVVTEANRRALAGGAFVVWLDADAGFLASRIRQKDHRPLLDGGVEVTIERLLAERAGWYREVADAVVEVGPVHVWSSSPKKDLSGIIAEILHQNGLGPAPPGDGGEEMRA